MIIPNLSKDPSGKTWLLQTALKSVGYDIAVDNWRGDETERALKSFRQSLEEPEVGDWEEVWASSFADEADVTAFNKCKMAGGSDSYCFGKGDNGIGMWGRNTSVDQPMCALPREIWGNAGKGDGSKVQVKVGDLVVDGILADTMPSLANLKNEARIDLNPGFQKALGWKPPFMKKVQWRWV